MQIYQLLFETYDHYTVDLCFVSITTFLRAHHVTLKCTVTYTSELGEVIYTWCKIR
jgi:hypothetical protein